MIRRTQREPQVSAITYYVTAIVIVDVFSEF